MMNIMTLDLSRTLSLLSSMYLCKPSKEALENWKKLLSEDTPYFLAELKNTIDEIDLDSERELEDLLWEYTRLFIGPYKLPCPLWESVYTSPKRLMMQEAYDDVRAFYAEMGLAINDQNVMYDHIGAELNFLAVLYKNIDDCPEKRFYYENLAKRFLVEHILKWAPQFADDMEKATDTAYYKVLALATKCIIQDLIKNLELTAESKN
ncbi:MAG: molecular chaperone TorD family protein [Nitrospirae bacterium]|nr:molecular chaperone TorD family protein [Nitrospirota bacterium]